MRLRVDRISGRRRVRARKTSFDYTLFVRWGIGDSNLIWSLVVTGCVLGNILTKIVRHRTDIVQVREYSYAHTTSRVAEAGVSFPTDLENYMSASAL